MDRVIRRAVEHAALSGSFVPGRFLYDAGDRKANVLAALAPLCQEVVDGGHILWRMQNSDRVRVLRGLQGDTARRNRLWRKRRPLKGDVFAQVLRDCLKGDGVPSLDDFPELKGRGMLREAISATIAAQAVVDADRREDLRTFETALYSASVQRADAARRAAVLPMELCGREAERRAVLEFLGSGKISNPIVRVSDGAMDTSGWRPRSTLLLGSPGMGKSAFLADVEPRITELVSAPWVLKFDFDQMTVLHGDLVALTEEATRQLGQQIPEVGQALSAKRREMAEMRLGAGSEADFSGSDMLMHEARIILEGVEPRPIVFLIDTIEELVAQDMRDTFAEAPTDTKFYGLIEWIDRAAALNGSSDVYVLYSGRIAPPVDEGTLAEWFTARLELDNLDDDAAELLLERKNPDIPEASRKALVEALGGHPLHLILAEKHLSSLPNRDRSKVLDDLVEAGLRGMGSETVLRTLYSRFLARMRVRNPQHGVTGDMVRDLAHPGLLMREVTAATLRSVIAPAVGVSFVSEEMVQEAFRILRDQIWLVNSAPGSEVISHRADVRRVMLPMMLGAMEAPTRAVLDGAARHYEASKDAAQAGYYRALKGETDWLHDDHGLATHVVAQLGQEELALLGLPVRALLKHLSAQDHVLSRSEIEALPEDMRLEEEITSDVREVRGRGVKGGTLRPIIVETVAEVETQALSAGLSAADRVEKMLRNTKRRDAFSILNNRLIHEEIEAAFLNGDFQAVGSIGMNALAAVEEWRDLSAPLPFEMPFEKQWLWRLTLAGMVLATDHWTLPKSLKIKIEQDEKKEFGRLDSPFESQGSIADFQMLLQVWDNTELKIGFYILDNRGKKSNDAISHLRNLRILAHSPMVLRQLESNLMVLEPNLIVLPQSMRTLSLLSPEMHHVLNNSSNGIKAVANRSSGPKDPNDSLLHKFESVAGRDLKNVRLWEDLYRRVQFERSDDSTEDFDIEIDLKASINYRDRAALNRIIRGQTPELHEAIAQRFAHEIESVAVEEVFSGVAAKARFWPGAAKSRVRQLSKESSGARSAIGSALELVRYTDLCGLLTVLTDAMAEVSDAPGVRSIARLNRELDVRWTWPDPEE